MVNENAQSIRPEELMAALAAIESGDPSAAVAGATIHDDPPPEAEAIDAVAPPPHEAANSLLPADELAAALDEIDRLCPEDAAAIPSLAGDAQAATASPSSGSADEGDRTEPAAKAAAPSVDSNGGEAASPSPGVAPAAAPAKPASSIRFVIAPAALAGGKGATSEAGGRAREASGQATTPHGAAGSNCERRGLGEHAASAGELGDRPTATFVPRAPLAKRVYRAIDGMLEFVNAPFLRVSEAVRNAIGVVAATSLAVSLLAIVVLPIVTPHRDAIAFVEEKRRALERASAEQAPPHGAASPSHGGPRSHAMDEAPSSTKSTPAARHP